MPSSIRVRLRSLASLQNAFLTILPRIELHGRIYFRHVRCQDRRLNLIAEMVALAWWWFLRLAQRGKDGTQFPMALASFAARAVKSGRRLCGQERTKDVMSPFAQQRQGFVVSSLPPGSTLNGNVFDEALKDNTQTPVDDQVCFRLDFPAWRMTHTVRDRGVIDDMLHGERTLDVARKYGLSQGRISQMRRQFHDDWRRFCGDQVDESSAMPV